MRYCFNPDYIHRDYDSFAERRANEAKDCNSFDELCNRFKNFNKGVNLNVKKKVK